MRLWRAVRKGVDAFVGELQTGRRLGVPPIVEPISNQAKSVHESELTEAGREALARKHHSESRLRDEGVPFIRHLPRIETRDEVKLRTKEEIAYRSLALTVVTAKAVGMRQLSVENAVKHLGLAPHFSPASAPSLSILRRHTRMWSTFPGLGRRRGRYSGPSDLLIGSIGRYLW